MKKRLILVIAMALICTATIFAYAANVPTPTVPTSSNPDTTKNEDQKLKTEFAKILPNLAKSGDLKNLETKIDSLKVNASCKASSAGVTGFGKWFLILLPLLLFLTSLVIIVTWLRKSNYQFGMALSNDSYTYRSGYEFDKATNQLVEVSRVAEGSPSASRFIAFITGLATIGFATTVLCFYYYSVFTGDCQTFAAGLDGVWKVLAAMGIGVVPYASKAIGGGMNTSATPAPAIPSTYPTMDSKANAAAAGGATNAATGAGAAPPQPAANTSVPSKPLNPNAVG